MSHQLFKLPRQLNYNGNLTTTPGGKAYFYQSGTTTPQAVYQDADLTVPHANPVVADFLGLLPAIYMNPGLRYKLTLKTSADVDLYTSDPINDQIPPTYTQTAAEVSAGVTPVDYSYPEGHLLRYSGNWNQAFSVASEADTRVLVPGGSYSIASQVTHTGDVDIECLGTVTITCTAASVINSIFKITGKVRNFGSQMILDGDDMTYLLFHCPTIFPELQNVTFRNCLSVAVLPGRNFGGANVNDYSGANGVGHGWLRNCRFENVGSIAIPAGTGASSDTSFGIVECQSDDQCGNVTNLFNMASMGYGYVHGGWFRGVSTTDPNMTQCGRCEYIGGRYEDMERGPTIGEDSDYVTISGGISSGMSFASVSLDARRGDNTVPYVRAKVDWTSEGNPDWHLFVQASGIHMSNLRVHGDGTATSSNAAVRLTDSLDVSIGTITAYDHGGGLLVQLGEGSAPVPGSSAFKTGDWQSDTSSLTAVRTSTNSDLDMGTIRVATANTDLSPLEDTLIVDASGGVVDVDVPGSTFDGVIGKVWTVIVRDSTNNVTITRDGGGATSINGGSSFTVRAGSPYTHLRIESIGGGNYIVSTPVLSSNGAFTISNELEDRTFDADTVTVAELADVVATLIQDLKRGS